MFAIADDVVIGCLAFPFTPCLAADACEIFCMNILGRDVVCRGVARFEDAPGVMGVGKRDAVEYDEDMVRGRFGSRRAGVVPDGFLAGAGFNSLWFH